MNCRMQNPARNPAIGGRGRVSNAFSSLSRPYRRMPSRRRNTGKQKQTFVSRSALPFRDCSPPPAKNPTQSVKNSVLECVPKGYAPRRSLRGTRMIDNRQIRKRLLLRHLSSPLVLAPFLFGVTMLAAAWTFEWKAAGLAAFAGLAGIVGGAGIFLTKLFLGSDNAATQIFQEMEADEVARKARDLDQLERRLESSDEDPRPEKALRDLRALVRVFQENKLKSGESHQLASLIDIHTRVIELFDHCVELLEQTIQLWETASSLHTPAARKPILDQRETIIDDIQGSVRQLSAALVGLKQFGAGSASTDRLKQMRSELDQSLKIAKTVETRVNKWMRESQVFKN